MLAAAHGAFPGVLGFAQWPPGDLLTDDGAARKWIFHARDFHLMFRSKKSGPGLLRGPTYTARGARPTVPPSSFHCHAFISRQSL